ncbi:MAG: 1-deoxy-D-xylulose-5-phosphate reductoisomerase [Crocinitomicaceae bacterium]|nr:1-deoxy-D-xylulose-5-phosphate reductoisomerase [Crocinitomicaceae bacterium]
MSKKRIAIMGSTGSIGTQALEVIQTYPEQFEVSVLTANNNADLLIQQALQFKPNVVVIANEELYDKVEEVLWKEDIKTYTGTTALEEVVQMDEIDLVLAGIVGFAGLRSTIKAIESGKNIALANKETLVVAGEIITKLALEKGVNIYPVDSEHSAIFQCLVGEFHNPIEKIILTASGGPFNGMKAEDLKNVTKEMALHHPKWVMGEKITIDSASMMNKGLEVIEAKWLFGVKPEQIEVVIHPESIVHSLVQFKDGAVKAQLGLPDMKLPIQYAFTYPNRLETKLERLNLAELGQLTFQAPDFELFKNLRLAYKAIEKGGNLPCALNAINEVTVAAFLNGSIGFLDIAELNERAMDLVQWNSNPSLNDLITTDGEARVIANNLINC